MFKLRPKDTPWEVVGMRSVEPVSVYHEEELEDIAKVSQRDISRTYVFDVRRSQIHKVTKEAMEFARKQLLQEVSKQGYNVLVLEGWKLTIYRREKLHRIEVQYHGRPAQAIGELPQGSDRPPFMEQVLRDYCHTRP
ncbi:hypothetical protein Moror_186 [Moniliophthora roreri MCA 2997]|uniref:Uncharacterized protein n=1 Tax=Moniliophthora roreri (strain MCA 2997) TaxID=1381753 RepID=V2Y000_MONRO|nr:hypothetical protein Moror_186 [Moniliophthora roreri MCA 2997]